MGTKETIFTSNCLSFGHLYLFLVLLSLCHNSYAQDKSMLVQIKLENLNPIEANVGRLPSSFVPDDEVILIPEAPRSFVKDLFVEDDKGVMISMRKKIKEREELIEYARNWHLESTGLIKVDSDKDMQHYLKKELLHYLDKRLSGEIKKADKKSTLYKVGKIQQTLRPASKVKISETVKLKFKARVLRGKATMQVVNPYVDYQTEAKLDGKVNMVMKKNLKDVGIVTALNYHVDRGVWIASVDKKLTEHWSTRVSSEQNDDKMAFTQNTDRKVEFNFNLGF